MKKHICLYAIIFCFVHSLFSQSINRNEYIKITDELFSQYSPKEKGWVIFKYDAKGKQYVRQEYTVSNSNTKQSMFKNIYVGAKYAIFINDGTNLKLLNTYSNEISSEYKEILSYNFPKIDGDFPHIVGKEIGNKYISLNDRPMSCDTFALQNGTFIPIFNKDNPKINENIYTQNGFIVPHLYGVIGYSYSIVKTAQGFILSNSKILFDQMGYLIHSYPEMGYNHKNPETVKLFPINVNLSYYDGNNFLISEKNKWFVCKVPEYEEIFNSYLNDEKSIFPKEKTLFSYFGDLSANSIRILTWESGTPAYFIANVQGVDYLFDYKKALIKGTGSRATITFPQNNDISGESIKPYYTESGRPFDYNGREEKPRYLEVKQGNVIVYYKYQEGEFKKIDNNPFKGNYIAVFTGSTYREYGNEYFGQILNEKVFPTEMTAIEIANAETEESRIKTDVLKTTLMYSASYNNKFPLKYYNGNQFFYRSMNEEKEYGRSDDVRLRIVNNSGEIIPLEHGDYRVNYELPYNWSDVYAVGASQKTERFSFYPEYTLSNISSTNIQEIGYGSSSYDSKEHLITKTFVTQVEQKKAYTVYDKTRIIKYDEIFPENPNIGDVKFIYSSRLSNNDILIIFEANIEFLSGQLNRMFGIEGVGKISRTFATSSYYKFIVVSEDGGKLKSNKNYLLPKTSFETNVAPVEGGFIIVSKYLGNVISLENNDFGRKSSVFSQEAGKNIIVTEGISFSNNVNHKNGIKIFKFNNSAELVNDLVVDNPSDEKINSPSLIELKSSENYLCLRYLSFEQAVVNEPVYVYKLFDFGLNLKSAVVGEKPQMFEDNGFIISKDDVFYLDHEKDKGERVIIPFR